MMTFHSIFSRLAVIAVAGLAAGCTISQQVEPVETAEIRQLCIERNEDVLMDGFQPTLQRLIEAEGIETRAFDGERPADCTHVLTYVANWRWDMAMYLAYARLDVFEDYRKIGSAEYDATSGGMNLDKFGSTEAKIEPLVQRLFAGS